MSHVFKVHFELKPSATGTIFLLLILAILIIPSETSCLGPLGPSGAIPTQMSFFREDNICLAAINPPLFFIFPGLLVDPLIVLKPR